VFDAVAWAEDMIRASSAAREVAASARVAFETQGVPVDQLRACEPEGTDATSLPHCMKVYLPSPAGAHGMVFEIDRRGDRLVLAYAAFGLRHPGRDVRQPSVYEIAHRRLYEQRQD
jgi:hypothetical protein